MAEKYKAKISVRAGDRLCVAVPKKLISSSKLSKGDKVNVILEKEEDKK